MKKISFLFFLITGLLCTTTFAQSADSVTDVIETEEITYGQAAYYSTVVLEICKDTVPYNESLGILKEKGAIRIGINDYEKIPMKDLCKILYFTWDIKGSLMLSTTKNPRYILKQLKADGIVPGNMDPGYVPTGHEFLNILTGCLEQYDLRQENMIESGVK